MAKKEKEKKIVVPGTWLSVTSNYKYTSLIAFVQRTFFQVLMLKAW